MALTYNDFLETTKFTEQTVFCKLLSHNLNHHNFQYQLGLNEDTIVFDPTGSRKSGGLYFTTNEYLTKFIDFGINVATIELCEGALFYIDPEGFKFKTNKFNITKIEQTEKICKIAVQQNGLVLQCVKNQTEEICKIAIQENVRALRYVENQTDEICKLAIQQNGYMLKYIKNQTEKICKMAVQRDGCALQYVKKQTEEICKLAVQQNGHALEHVKEQIEEICKMAVQQNYRVFKYVKTQTEEIRNLFLQLSSENKN